MLDTGESIEARPGILASSHLLPRGRQVDFTQLSSPDRWNPELAVPFNQRVIGRRF